MGRKKVNDFAKKKTRSLRINDNDELLLREYFNTRQKAIDLLIWLTKEKGNKIKFYINQYNNRS